MGLLGVTGAHRTPATQSVSWDWRYNCGSESWVQTIEPQAALPALASAFSVLLRCSEGWSQRPPRIEDTVPAVLPKSYRKARRSFPLWASSSASAHLRKHFRDSPPGSFKMVRGLVSLSPSSLLVHPGKLLLAGQSSARTLQRAESVTPEPPCAAATVLEFVH